MDLCEKIYEAKTCLITLTTAYVKAVSKGHKKDEMLQEISDFHGYIDLLERYEKKCFKCLDDVCSILEKISLLCGSKCGC